MTGVVYTLDLEDACWYVGYTKDPATRIASHFLISTCQISSGLHH